MCEGKCSGGCNEKALIALENMLGVFDTPATRLALGKQWQEDWHGESCRFARDVLKESNSKVVVVITEGKTKSLTPRVMNPPSRPSSPPPSQKGR